VTHLDRADVDAASVGDLVHGRPVTWPGSVAGPLAVHHEGRLIAVAVARRGQLWPLKVFPRGDAPKGTAE
jgi:hypothetical protein